jgi:gas vesicle protein
VDDRGRIGLAIGFGAVIGGAVGYLLFTDRGRELRDRIEPRLQDLLSEVDQLSRTFERARSAATEGWQSFSKLMTDETRSGADTVERAVKSGVAAVDAATGGSGRPH